MYHTHYLLDQTVSLPSPALRAFSGDGLERGLSNHVFPSDGSTNHDFPSDGSTNHGFPSDGEHFTYYPADVYNNGNVIVDSCGETQTIRWLIRVEVFM